MLQLTDIVKSYKTGDTAVQALKGISIAFRRNEFVSVLGPSGCGKTTLLNIIGGLDRYDSGDLAVSGRSTKAFKDADWDSYRNHSIGFVFQSYNLIPHQTVLSNVELALTLSGVSKTERRNRAKQVLEKVGLGDQLHKKPNQMSGGQMQRVAIARALVNDPEILLADEPTGALDSETSVQIMDLLKEIAEEKLVIMVTHNPELAEQYSTRIVRLLDGVVVGDSDPYEGEPVVSVEASKQALKQQKKAEKKRKKKTRTSMSFWTALSLSTNNLMTKKGRTFMTSFAGSIGIIGIALILSLSNGFQLYINTVQQDALSTYPMSIERQTMNISSMLESMAQAGQKKDHPLDKIYANSVMSDMMGLVSADVTTNNLSSFKTFIEDESNGIGELLSTPPQYGYNVDLNVYKPDVQNGIVQISPENILTDLMGDFGMMPDSENSMMNMSSISSMGMGNMSIWTEIIDNPEMIDAQYDIVAGRMPEAYNELVIVTDKNNEIPDMSLYALGILDGEELMNTIAAMMNGGEYEPKEHTFTYDEILSTQFSLVLPADYYARNEETGLWEDMRDDDNYMNELVASGEKLKVVGILRPAAEATATCITGTIGYTRALTDYMITETNKREIVKAQLASPETDIFTGLTFKDVEEKAALAERNKGEEEKKNEESTTAKPVSTGALHPTVGNLNSVGAPTVRGVATTMTEDEVHAYIDANVPANERDMMHDFVTLFLKNTRTRSERKQLTEYLNTLLANYEIEGVGKITGEQAYTALSLMGKEQKLEMISAMITGDTSAMQGQLPAEIPAEKPEETPAEEVPEEPKVEAAESLSVNKQLLGIADLNDPDRINLYPKDFESKEELSAIIQAYNQDMRDNGKDENVIEYTDYIGIFLSSVTKIINVVSYVLIAFVAISLIVSSIMIGIITYISVLERTKEIGILRSIGASKRDISRVFNAETLIVGLTAGVIGIGTTLLLNIPVNIVIKALVDIPNVSRLPLGGAIILIIISVLLTVIAGLIPSRFAAKRDPVVALRTE